MVMSLSSLSFHCSARHYASRLMLQGAGLRRRQVTRISIKGIIDVGTAERKNNTFMYAFGAKAYLEICSKISAEAMDYIHFICTFTL